LFWAPFQRLFAGVLLSHPLRRFWDVLIAESSDVHAHPHPRHVLVDLAFGVLQGLKDRLLLAQSPEAVQELFSTFMLELSDPEDLLDLLIHAEALLWQGFRRHEVLRLWDVTCSKFARFLWRYGQQDDLVLRQLVTLDPFASDLTMGPSWLTPDFILKKVLPELKEALPHIMATSNPPCGLPRQVPEALLELMLVESANGGFSLASLVGASWTEEEELGLSSTISLVHPIDLAPSQILSAERWAEILKAKLPGWLGKSQEIFDAFRCESPLSAEDQSHMCFNEFIAALICCSQGTAGDKARALFDLCAEERMGQPELPHRIPLSHVVIQREAPDTLQMGPTAVSSVTPTGTHVLEIEVWGNEYGQRAGYVFVDSLRPFTTTSYKGDEELRRQGLPFVVWSDPSPAAKRVGEVRLGISWTPRNPQTADVGTLSLCIRRLQLFDWSYDAALETMPRPWLQARASDKDGVKRPILLQGKLAFAQMDGLLRSWAHQASQSMTWTSKEAILKDDQSWSWAKDVMQSASNLRFRAMSSASKGRMSTSTISLFRCRQLAECLVRRSGLYLTQRQVWQLADQCFQRSGGSRTILDALLLAGVEPAPDARASGSQVRKMCQESGRDYVDITALVLREMEKSLGANTIELGKLCLDQFFPGVNTVWILLPGTKAEAKALPTSEPFQLTVDLAESELNAEVLTKDEFVSCILAHPTLSEALKRRQPQLLVMDAMRTLTLDVILELNPSPVDTDVVPRYLPLLFGETPGSASGRGEGAGHGIKVFLTDTMWDFLEKVQDACQQLANLPAQANEVSKRYASVKLGLDYEVFAFVPQSLAENPKESLQDLVRAHADASSWLILNKDCTLESYAGILYQQPNMLPCLKVSKR